MVDITTTAQKAMFMKIKKTLGVPVIVRTVIHTHSTVIILDVYDDMTNDKLADIIYIRTTLGQGQGEGQWQWQ